MCPCGQAVGISGEANSNSVESYVAPRISLLCHLILSKRKTRIIGTKIVILALGYIKNNKMTQLVKAWDCI